MHSASGTPMYNTPGSRTPMYGSQTPLYDGSRTPHYGSMTPSHGEEGSRTPGRSGAWDPTVSNTPACSKLATQIDSNASASSSERRVQFCPCCSAE